MMQFRLSAVTGRAEPPPRDPHSTSQALVLPHDSERMTVPVTLHARRLLCRWTTAAAALLSVLGAGPTAIPTALAAVSNFTTVSYNVLLPQASGVIPNVYGPVRGKVSSSLAVSLEFAIVKGLAYAAGAVTATTDANGRLMKLAFLKQACSIVYAATGAVTRVLCTTASKRMLEGFEEDSGRSSFAEDAVVDQAFLENVDAEASGSSGHAEPREAGSHHVSRRLSDCSSCLAAVNTTVATSFKVVCGASFARLVPATYSWAKAAAAALCAMSVKLGRPLDVAYKACRCSCEFNDECPLFTCSQGQCDNRTCALSPNYTCLGVCSEGVCLSQKLGVGQPCPDADDDDCSNWACARGSFPMGPYVCCPSGGQVEAAAGLYEGEWYCTGKRDGSQCVKDNWCKNETCSADVVCQSGVCSGGFCRAQKIEVGGACPDADDYNCVNGRCAQSAYPSGDYVCCPSNHSGFVPNKGKFCTGIQELGSYCEADWMCSSGACSKRGICVNGVTCINGKSDNCGETDGDCGRAKYPSGEYICCSFSGRADVKWNRPDTGYVYETYCPDTALDYEPCGADWMCVFNGDDGIGCNNGVCAPKRRRLFDWSGWCPFSLQARESYPWGDYACCARNSTPALSSNHLDTWGARYCNRSFGLGASCDANAMCASGVCSGMVCREKRLGAGEPCDFVYGTGGDDCYMDGTCADCESGYCAKGSYPSGVPVCCANDTIWSHTFESRYCAGIQGVGYPCDRHEMCSSGICSVHVVTNCAAGVACPKGVCLRNDNNDALISEADGMLSVQPKREIPPWGRPTGGGKFQFIAVVNWWNVQSEKEPQDMDPRVRIVLRA
jgi:hypothetical protein